MSIRSLLLTLLAWSILPPAIWAQSNLGAILGTAMDASEAAMPGVSVNVTNTDTGQTRQFRTGPSGNYEVNHLVAGHYRVEADAAGFRHFVYEGITLFAGQTIRADVRFEVATIAQQTTVVAEGTPQIETESSSLSDLRDTRQYRSFPMAQNREPYTILTTLPNFQVAQSQNSSSTYKFTIAGSRTGQSEFQMDGVAAPNNGNPELSASQTMESTLEVKLQAVNNTAEYGEPGIYQMVSRSGGNQIHGSGYYHHDNSAFKARDFFEATKPKGLSHSFGGNLSGPVFIPRIYNGRNRTFFLLAYDAIRSPGQGTRIDSVPSAAFRGGDFSSLKTGVKDPLSQLPFPGNIVPASRQSSVSLAFQNLFYPVPNFGPAGGVVNNLFTMYPNPGKENMGDVRLDQYFGSRNNFFVRVGARQFPATRLKTLPTIGYPSILRTFRTLVIADTHTFSPRLVNEFRVGQITSNNKYIDGGQRGLDVIRKTGLQGLDNLPDDWGMPVVSITGFSSLTHNGNNRYVNSDRNRQISDNMTYIRGRHTIKFGIDVRHQFPELENIPLGLYGQFSFGGSFSTAPYADFLLGIPQTSTRVPLLPKVQRFETDWFFFGQDEFKITPRLTVSAGLRYEYQRPLSETGGRIYNFDPQSGQIVIPTDKRNQVNPLFNPAVPITTASAVGFPETGFRFIDANNFAPRIGFAYRLTQSNDFVIRGGYGIFVVNVPNGLLTTYEGGPFASVSATFSNQLVNGAPLFQFPNAFPATGTSASTSPPSLAGLNPRMQNPYVQQWNLTLERQMAGVGLRLSYTGTRGAQLLYLRNINLPVASTIAFAQNRRPYPLYGNISYQDNGGNNIYHGLQLEGSRRLGRALTFNSAWTWATNISDVEDTGAGVYGTSIENPRDRSRERGREGYAVQHRVIGNIIYTLPFGRQQHFLNRLPAPVEGVLGGWHMIAVGTYQTGLNFTPMFSGVDTTGTGVFGGRPDRLATGSLPDASRSIYNWFDKTAFAVPALGTYGNSGRGILTGPSLGVLHLGIGKDFPIRERARLNIEAAFQNVLNHPNFSLPNVTVNNAAGGSISSTVTNLYSGGENNTQARSLQLRGRITF